MSTTFYRVWLPISIVVHIALMLVLYFIPATLPDAKAEEGPVYLIDIAQAVEPEETKVEIPDRPAIAIPPVEDNRTVQVVENPGVPKPKTNSGEARTESASVSQGPGDKETAAPKLMTSPTSDEVVPEGVEGGLGASGDTEELGESGPTYGAAAKGTPAPVYPKLAAAQGLEGTVDIKVQINTAGGIDWTAVARSSGHNILDRAAQRAAQSWSFEPAMKNGQPVEETMVIQFTFADSKVRGQVL